MRSAARRWSHHKATVLCWRAPGCDGGIAIADLDAFQALFIGDDDARPERRRGLRRHADPELRASDGADVAPDRLPHDIAADLTDSDYRRDVEIERLALSIRR
ncbi:hypothetical protein [Hyphomicrobium sp. D-2]|uniref:hypothetical protein n=1 Tax=Hyphomicrobium sp. D-2 TaxID=3041621 RepID=UPI002456B818|nr:hypothetical protein [Hyphomicrobium sp. D-2]MDH4982611.1 hypothetical protein [Hyphomicrobium sp. D-2]